MGLETIILVILIFAVATILGYYIQLRTIIGIVDKKAHLLGLSLLRTHILVWL